MSVNVNTIRRSALKLVTAYIPLLFASLFFLLPVFVMLNTGLKSFAEVKIQEMWALPRHLTFEGFLAAFVRLLPNIRNSFFVTLPASVLSAAIGSVNGYIFTKWKFKGSNTVFTLMLFGMFIPLQSILIPLVAVLKSIGLYGSIPGLILAHVVYGIPLTTLIFRNYYVDIPDSLVEASCMDGLEILQTYRRIILPLSGPAFVVVLIWQFTSIWNEFLFSLVITQDPNVQPINVALANMAGSYYVEWNIQMAGALIAGIPTLLVYIFLGKFLIRGLLAGSVKA
ncbi:MAG TPA: carbohydrate ABC transporter permease [Spirochaetia bacterium]|nr:carbohydrate ABC transporter permease [Spirochaetia bacterium]